MYRIKIVWPRR